MNRLLFPSFSVISDLISDSGSCSYPNDSEKLMLASQTGLSKNQVNSLSKTSPFPFFLFFTFLVTMLMFVYLLLVQVSNWFINARVRLWKPMIEEMYKEEFGDSSEDSNPPVNNCLALVEATDCVED